MTMLSFGLFAQGTLEMNGNTLATIPQYDLSNGDTQWVIDLQDPSHTVKWCWYGDFNSLAGTKDGVLAVFISNDNGVTWVAYPEMETDVIDDNVAFSFDDNYTVYDKIKITCTVNNITGGTVDPNIRIFTNPTK